jgi:hypothetical protein
MRGKVQNPPLLCKKLRFFCYKIGLRGALNAPRTVYSSIAQSVERRTVKTLSFVLSKSHNPFTTLLLIATFVAGFLFWSMYGTTRSNRQ